MDRKVCIFARSRRLPFQGKHLDGAFPGLKAWAVLLNRFAVRSIDFCIKIRVETLLPVAIRQKRCPIDGKARIGLEV